MSLHIPGAIMTASLTPTCALFPLVEGLTGVRVLLRELHLPGVMIPSIPPKCPPLF